MFKKLFCLVLALIGVVCAGCSAEKGPVVGDITPQFYDFIVEKKGINEDVRGWLFVPDTNIDGIVLQNQERSNEFYLKHDIYKEPSTNGVFCADYSSKLRKGMKLSRNTTLYSHSFEENPDGILFEQTRRFLEPTFAMEHPYIFFSTEEKDMAWEIFAVYYTTVELPYIDSNMPWINFEPLLEVIYASSLYDYGIRIEDSDKILTLSTCTYSVPGHEKLTGSNDYRYVIMARLVDSDTPIKKEAYVSLNENILAPDDQPFVSYNRNTARGLPYAKKYKNLVPVLVGLGLVLAAILAGIVHLILRLRKRRKRV